MDPCPSLAWPIMLLWFPSNHKFTNIKLKLQISKLTFKLIPEIPYVHILVIPWRSLSGLRIIDIDAHNLAAHILITTMHIRAQIASHRDFAVTLVILSAWGTGTSTASTLPRGVGVLRASSGAATLDAVLSQVCIIKHMNYSGDCHHIEKNVVSWGNK